MQCHKHQDIAFLESDGVGSHDVSDFEAQSHGPLISLCTLHGMDYSRPRNTQFRALAAYPGGLVTAGFLKEFQSLPHPLLPGLAWRTCLLTSDL